MTVEASEHMVFAASKRKRFAGALAALLGLGSCETPGEAIPHEPQVFTPPFRLEVVPDPGDAIERDLDPNPTLDI